MSSNCLPEKQEFSAKITRYFELLKRIQETDKPSDFYCRNVCWNGEPCDNCGSTEKPSKVGGRYTVGGAEDTNFLLVCGNCLDELEKKFDLYME